MLTIRTAAAGSLAALAAPALAGPVLTPLDSGPAAPARGTVSITESADRLASSALGFENYTVGAKVTALDFGDIAATVTHAGKHNKIHRNHDGHGAVAAEGQNFWKVIGGSMTLDFGTERLSGISFWYSDLEWATLNIRFDDDAFALRDSNSRNPRFFSYTAADGADFSRVSFEWVGHNNDGIGFDGFSVNRATIPTPAGALALTALAAYTTRRRRD